MFKVAISDLERLSRLQRTPFAGRLWTLRMTAIPEASQTEREAMIRHLTVPGSVFMTTYAKRFDDLNPIVIRLLHERPGHHQIHDVGVSAGGSSVELLRAITTASIECTFCVSDKFCEIWSGGQRICRVYYADGSLMEAYIFGIVAQRNPTWRFPISKALYHLLKHIPPPRHMSAISLFEPRLQDLISDQLVQKIEYDVFATPIIERFTFVRCMNLLNLGYFGREQLLSGVNNLARSLKPGGLLQLGRTAANGQNAASFFEKIGDSLVEIEAVGGGSEIQDLVQASGHASKRTGPSDQGCFSQEWNDRC